jgi:hypothetical protein
LQFTGHEVNHIGIAVKGVISPRLAFCGLDHGVDTLVDSIGQSVPSFRWARWRRSRSAIYSKQKEAFVMELKAILAIGRCLFIAGGAVFLFVRNKRKQR